MSETLVIAIGGNSLIADPKHITVADQYQAAVHTAESLIDIFSSDKKIAIVHGNGPQVGFILRRSEIARALLHSVPLDSCVADTEGAIGYHIQMAIRNALVKKALKREVTTVVTETLVDLKDPAFTSPSKPIGSFMLEEEALKFKESEGWSIQEDAGRGWRRVVPSPEPKDIVEMKSIRQLVDNGVIAIAAGGGGIPVIQDENGMYKGVEAVIDKDLAAALLAGKLDAGTFIISTAVEKVCLNFGKPDQKALSQITLTEAEQYMREGHFAKGSMLPKIQAMLKFMRSGNRAGKVGIITDPEHLAAALEGRAGTRIIEG